MRIRPIATATLCVVVLPLILAPGCPWQGPPAPDGDNGPPDYSLDNLTGNERAALNAATRAAGALNQAVRTIQDAAGVRQDNAQVIPADLSVGTCPEVSKTSTVREGEFDLAIDFGDGCSPPDLDGTDYVCSGNAVGSFSTSAKSIQLIFNHIDCNGHALDGAVDVGYDLSSSQVALDGGWDLMWTSPDAIVGTTGEGTCNYQIASLATRIATFAGSVSDPTDDWSIVMTDVLVSYPTYLSYIPYGGTIMVSGTDIRTLTLRFNEQSPATGEVELSIDGSPFFPVNLLDL